MASSPLHPNAHLVLSPQGVPNGEDPWLLTLVNGPVGSRVGEHEHTAILAWSASGAALEIEMFHWMAYAVGRFHHIPVLLPWKQDYVTANGMHTMMTPEMKDAYPKEG